MTKSWIGTASGNAGDYGTAANWSPSGVPVNGDDVIIANSSQGITAGFDQSLVILNSIVIDLSYTGLIGDGASDFLQIAASSAVIGQRRSSTGSFAGSKRLNLDFGSSTACQITVNGTASRGQDQNRQPLRIRAVNSATDLQVYSGAMAISDDSDNSSTFGDISVNLGSVSIGAGVTLTNLITSGGIVNIDSSVTSADIKGGTVNFFDGIAANTIGTLTVSDAGIVNHFASGTITTLAHNGGTVDLTKTQLSKTVTNYTANTGAVLITDTSTVTLTNDVALTSGKKLTMTIN